jgi:SprT-like protein
MPKPTKRQVQAAFALNLDLFEPEIKQVPAPATLHTRIQAYAEPSAETVAMADTEGEVVRVELPDVEELCRLFDRYNWMYFSGRLPRPRIEISNRMTTAGAYYPGQRLIKIGRKYHELFPDEVVDTLKHEMIHLIHLKHGAAFKAEAARIGASVRAQSHPDLRRPPRYVYECPGCGLEYPRQKRIVLGSCGKCSPGGKYDRRFKLVLKSSPRRKS